jgi:hypothetical protein
MKEVILAAFVALAVTAGIASAGIASLADGAAVLINASSHSDPHDNTTSSLGGPYVGGGSPAFWPERTKRPDLSGATVQNLGGEQEQNRYLALGMGWSRWPGRPEARSSGKLFTPRFWTVSASNRWVPAGEWTRPM